MFMVYLRPKFCVTCW